MNSYYTIRKHLQAFIREKHRMADIPFGQMEEDFLECLQHHPVGKLGHSQPHYRTMALAVKKVCRLAYREGLTERQLFAHVEIERGENKQPRALAGASLDKLQALIFEPYEVELETARNLFLFFCNTGVAYCDMVALGREHLFTDDEGALWLKFRRQKTNTLCRVKLLPEAVRLIEQYQSDERTTPFAPIVYSAYLTQLKALQLRAGISIPLSVHMARHREFYKHQIINRLKYLSIKGANDKETSELLYPTLFCHFKEPFLLLQRQHHTLKNMQLSPDLSGEMIFFLNHSSLIILPTFYRSHLILF